MSRTQGVVWVRSAHHLFACGLIRLLEDHQYRAQPHRQEADLCLQDLCLSPIYPLWHPDLPTLALVEDGLSPETLAALLRAGYRGYLRPESDPARLAQALEAVARGELWAERAVLAQTLDPARPARLTTREQEVLHYLRRGWSNAELARHLGITVKTVKTHVSAIFAKIGARDRLDLVANHPEGGGRTGGGGDDLA